MYVIGRSSGCQPDHCKPAHKLLSAEPTPGCSDASRGSGNSGNSANLENLSKLGLGRADDFLAETCANLRKPVRGDAVGDGRSCRGQQKMQQMQKFKKPAKDGYQAAR